MEQDDPREIGGGISRPSALCKKQLNLVIFPEETRSVKPAILRSALHIASKRHREGYPGDEGPGPGNPSDPRPWLEGGIRCTCNHLRRNENVKLLRFKIAQAGFQSLRIRVGLKSG